MTRLSLSRLLIGAVVVAAAALLASALRPRPVAVDLAPAAVATVTVTVDEDGRTRIRERYVVSTPLAGRVQRVGLRPGDLVAAGDTLITVVEPTDPALLDERTLAQAEARALAAAASLERAEVEVERALEAREFAAAEAARLESLGRDGGVTDRELDLAAHEARLAERAVSAARFGREIAAYELEQARAALLYARGEGGADGDGGHPVAAPVDGQVLRVLRESAGVLPAGAPLVEVGDPTDLEVVVDVLSADAVSVEPGQLVLLEHWGGAGALEGRVRTVEPAAFTKVSALGVEEQRVNVVVDFVGPRDGRSALGDGYRVEARIVTWEGKVLSVPAGALFRRGEGWAVFVAEEGVARLAPVEAGRTDGARTEILGGLAPGAEVVLHPSDRVEDGVRITTR